jgi:DNA-binding NarL/FixJ family response regulator
VQKYPFLLPVVYVLFVKTKHMMQIIYLEEKELTRTSFVLAIEKQADCKVVYHSGVLSDFHAHIQTTKAIPDLCIIADSYPYIELVKIIQALKYKSKHSFILLKSDTKFMKGICFLLKNGLHGLFFTDEPLIDLKQCVYKRTRFKLSADKLKLFTSNRVGEIDMQALQYNTTPLTKNEIVFIQACTKDLNYEEIAQLLQKSVSTIYGYRDRVFKKLQVKQRTAMVMTALKRNYIDL